MTRPPTRQRHAPWRVRRSAMAVALTLVSTAVVVGAVPLPGGLSEGVPAGLLAASPACAAPAADGTISVAVAVDPGGVPGMAGGLETMCVRVPEGATGADVLAARARALGRPLPRYASSGLLCAIDGQPATGCGERVDGAYRYWAYFLGTGGWTYAGTGPALRRANAATLEGWRFVAGAGNATDPPPRASASPTATCPPPPPTTAAPVVPVPSPAPTTPTPTPGPGGGSDMGGPGSRGDAVVGARTGGIGDAGADAGSTAGGVTDPSAGAEGGAAPGSAVTDDAAGTDTGGSGAGDADGRGADDVAGAPVVATSSSGGPPVGALVIVALVVLLGAGAMVQVRRRGAA